MINVSNAFKQELFNDIRNYLEYVDITLKDGTVLNLTNKDLWGGGLTIEDAVSKDNSFDVGSAIINKCTVVINNIYDDYSQYDFGDAKVVVYVGLNLPDGTTERIRKGTYTVDETAYNGSIITLQCFDNMKNFDKPYSESQLIYPATLNQIIRDACDVCKVTLQTYNFPHDNFVVQTRPDDEAITFREVVSWCAQIACCFCRCDTLGRLELKWYNQKILEETALDGGDFNVYDLDTRVDGGDFKTWNTGTVISGGEFGDRRGMHMIYSLYSLDIATDDVVITGVRVLEKNKEENQEAITTYQSGTDGYVVSIENNQLIKGGAGQTVAQWVGERLIGFRFRKANITHSSDPTIEAGDVGYLVDRKGNMYRIVMSSTKFSIGNSQNTVSSAQNPARNSAARFSAETKNYVEFRKDIEKERTDREKALDDLQMRIDNSSGLFTTEVTQSDGSTIFYMHDKPTLADSMIVWKMTAEAWGVSTDGGKTYNAGMTVDGDTIVRILTATGVNADWVKTGAFQITKNGKTMVLMDIDTGQVILRPDVFELSSGQTINSIAQTEASSAIDNFVDSVYDPKIASLQAQIDGQIETWYYDYEPTLNNYPASDWKKSTEAETEAERRKHEGDLFYWKSKGYSYRFFKDGSTWKWQIITDSDITKALADASKAQDTADSKRRVFLTTPVPPYDKGDLWTQGDTGDIMTCVTSRANGSYVSSDWEKRNKYIDQTAADTAASNAVDGQTQDDIFDKLTNNRTVQGLFLDEDGNIYFSFSIAKGGKLTLGGADNINGVLEILNKDGVKTGYIDNTGAQIFSQGTKTYDGSTYTEKTYLSSGELSFLLNDTKVGAISSSLRNYQNTFWQSYYESDMMTIASNKGIAFKTKTERESSGSTSALIMTIVDGGVYVHHGELLIGGSGKIKWISSAASISNYHTGGLQTDKSFKVGGNLYVDGEKNRIVKTKNYGKRLLSCYEMPSPMFGDIGEGETDESGECYVDIGDIFSETVSAEIEYQVFLQKEGEGDIWISEKNPHYFLVKGTKNLKFAWEIKAKQKGFEFERLEQFDDKQTNDNEVNYETEYTMEIERLIEEQEELLDETA